MSFELLYVIFIVVTVLNYIFLDIKVDKLKKEIIEKDTLLSAFAVLDKSIKKLNEALKSHEKRLDILESGHPDSDIDYGEVDDDANVIAVWFNGKKYVPEDKKDEDTSTFYADNKVVAETTRPDPQPESRYKCSDCVRFRRECIDGKWSGICSVDNVIMSNDEQYICDKFRLYKSTADLVTSDKDEAEYIRFNHIYWDMDGNNKADRVAKRIDELQCEIQRLNMIAQFGCTTQELRQRWKELMQNDT